MSLNIIDFSDGIRPEEIQENFEKLEDQISRERLGVGGSGIAYGLDISFNVDDTDFSITVSEGSIIDEKGDEIFIPSQKINIEPPILSVCKELVKMNIDKQVVLKHAPYALNRRSLVEYLSTYEPELSGINVKYRNSISLDDFIRVRAVNGKVLTISGSTAKELEITYSYSAKRIDVVYIDNEFNIKIKQGTTSTSPSIVPPLDAKYELAYLEIDNEYREEGEIISRANIRIKQDVRSIRNLYTDKDGVLYLCGVPFDDLQIIHIREPKNPKPSTVWLNPLDNTLYYWHSTDNFVYKNKVDIDKFYDKTFDGDILFATGGNFKINSGELKVYLNGVELVKDRDYEEVSQRLATSEGFAADDNNEGNAIRILQTILRSDNDDYYILKPNDKITYTITYSDGQYMWVPLNKQSYVNSKNTKVFCTWYDNIPDEYKYEKESGNACSYFESDIANLLDGNRDKDAEDFYPYKYQYFLFDRTKDMNMIFTPDRGELTVMINQIPLHVDQYKEITIYDLLSDSTLPKEIIEAAANKFGWDSDYINNNFLDSESYDNCGIGFYLLDPLDAGLNAETEGYKDPDGSNNIFVEATVQRRICAGPITRKLERTATFVLSDYATDEAIDGRVVTILHGKYAFGESQLEVFKDGRKLVNGLDYKEEFGFYRPKDSQKSGEDPYDFLVPIDTENNTYDDYVRFYYTNKSRTCNKFELLEDIGDSVISYKITTNIYSYDHVNNYMDRLITNSNNFEEYISNLRNELNIEIARIDNILNNLPDTNIGSGPTENMILSLGQMPPTILENMIKSLEHINFSIDVTNENKSYDLTQLGCEEVYVKDYLNVFIRYNKTIGNESIELDKNLIRDEDYEIVTVDGKQYIKFTNKMNLEGKVFISGIKLADR